MDTKPTKESYNPLVQYDDEIQQALTKVDENEAAHNDSVQASAMHLEIYSIPSLLKKKWPLVCSFSRRPFLKRLSSGPPPSHTLPALLRHLTGNPVSSCCLSYYIPYVLISHSYYFLYLLYQMYTWWYTVLLHSKSSICLACTFAFKIPSTTTLSHLNAAILIHYSSHSHF